MIHIIILIVFLKIKCILFSFTDFIQKSVSLNFSGLTFSLLSQGSGHAMNFDTSYPVLGQISQVRGTILHKTTLISDPSCRFGSPQAILTFDQLAKIQGSHFPLRFDNSLERLTELSKALYLLLVLLLQKDRNQNKPKGKMHSVRSERALKMKLSWSPELHCPPSTLMYDNMQSTGNQESSPNTQRPGFLSRFHYVDIIDWITGHLAELNLQPPIPPQRSGW